VTFLFTDIEGSTRRWEADAAAMRAALLKHDQVLRDAIESHDGFIFSHTSPTPQPDYSAGSIFSIWDRDDYAMYPSRSGCFKYGPQDYVWNFPRCARSTRRRETCGRRPPD
jgi:hypothetical protein